MRKLYLKIVVAIWTVMLATTVGVAVAVNAVRPDDGSTLRRFLPPNPLDGIAQRAAAATEQGTGREGLIGWFESRIVEQSGMPPIALLDAAGNVLAGDPPPRSETPGSGTGPPARRMLSTEFEHGGERYRIVSAGPFRVLHAERSVLSSIVGRGLLIALRPPAVWWLLLVAVPLSVVLSIAIARYLVSPLGAVEQAGRRLSEGDLSARVGSALGNRGDEIADFAAAFDRMAGRIEKLVRTHKDLLRDVSHELRSPLARAHAVLSLARQRTKGVVDNELDRLETEIERLDGMIGKLLTFSRLESGERETSREPVELADLLADIVDDSAFEAGSRGRTVHFHAEQGTRIHGDPGLLTSGFENVIRNALRHTPDGGAVEVSLRRDPASPAAIVRIRDHGDGVPQAELHRIFEPFYRVADSAGFDDGHAGIGLAIAKRAVVLHGGDIDAANAPDGGLVVTVSLPVADVPAP